MCEDMWVCGCEGGSVWGLHVYVSVCFVCDMCVREVSVSPVRSRLHPPQEPGPALPLQPNADPTVPGDTDVPAGAQRDHRKGLLNNSYSSGGCQGLCSLMRPNKAVSYVATIPPLRAFHQPPLQISAPPEDHTNFMSIAPCW